MTKVRTAFIRIAGETEKLHGRGSRQEMELYIRGPADRHVLGAGKELQFEPAKIKTVKEAPRLAVRFEKDSAIFPLGMREAVCDGKARDTVALPVKKERQHVRRLSLQIRRCSAGLRERLFALAGAGGSSPSPMQFAFDRKDKMGLPGDLLTTAMAVMPHRNVERALRAAMSLDIPFWPQLPLLSYHEDMYVQAAEHFPGILTDFDKRTIQFSMEKFIAELEETLNHFGEPEFFDVSENYSSVYHRFLKMDLSSRPAIRGQLEGPISFGLNVRDQDNRPILFNDTVRSLMLDFMAKRINSQLNRLKKLNPNAFMFVDEPGLQ